MDEALDECVGREAERLVRALEVGAAGQLIFVELSAPGARRALPEQLIAAGFTRPFLYFHFGDRGARERRGHPVMALAEALQSRAEGSPEVLFVDGVEAHQDFSATPREGDTIEALSVGRERLASLGVILVFLLPGYVVELLRQHAVSLWSWRSYHFVLDGEATGAATRSFDTDVAGLASAGASGEAARRDPTERERTIRSLRRFEEDQRSKRSPIEPTFFSVVIPLVRELQAAGRYRQALDRLDEAAAELGDSDLVEHQHAQALLAHWRGVLLRDLGQPRESLQALEEASGRLSRAPAPDRVALADTLAQQSATQVVLGDLTTAERLAREALSWRRQLGVSGALVADSLSDLGSIALRQSDHAAAERYFEEALGLLRAGGNRAHEALTLHALALLRVDQGRAEEALVLSEQALATERELFGERHPAVASALSNHAYIEAALGRLADAERDAREAVALTRESLGPNHPSLFQMQRNLAVILLQR